jgi:hypothetical protein
LARQAQGALPAVRRDRAHYAGGAAMIRRYRYIGLAMPERKGTECACLVWPPARTVKKNALIEFSDGWRVVVPARTLRRLK